MSHYVYNAEGAINIIGLETIKQLGYYIKKARAKGKSPSKIIGGVQYYDVDILLDIKDKNSKSNEKSYKNIKPARKIQLSLF